MVGLRRKNITPNLSVGFLDQMIAMHIPLRGMLKFYSETKPTFYLGGKRL